MRRDWLLLGASVLGTLLVALGALRLLAPELLGVRVPLDRQVVRLDKAVPAFYDGVFAGGAPEGAGSMVNDPLVGHRHVPLVGENSPMPQDWGAPFDLLGFRNRSVPVVADVVAIGDSQTLGAGVRLEDTWPRRLGARLGPPAPVVYTMASGGWGAVQYLHMFDKALRFRPRVVVVAFYTGNDPVDALYLAYHFDAWKGLRGAPERPESAPSAWPPRPDEDWPVRFDDGTRTVFTPRTRLASNDRAYPGTAEGYRIILEAGRRMAASAASADVAVLFTVIPTKELVFAPKVAAAGVTPPPEYARLAADERTNIEALAVGLSGLPGTAYVDVVAPLQRAAFAGAEVYRTDANGHPEPAGYEVIAAALAPAVAGLLPVLPGEGLVRVPIPDGSGAAEVMLVRDGGVWRFKNDRVLRQNGWTDDLGWVPARPARDLAHLPFRGLVEGPDPARFGPRVP